MMNQMKVCLVYVFPCLADEHHVELALRFITTYREHPAGMEHELVVVCNGGGPSQPLSWHGEKLWSPRDLFSFIPGTQFFLHDNSGFDIGAYQAVAKHIDADIMVCLGQSVYFHREGWLKRWATGWESYGPGMYGPFASHQIRPHLNTTAFAVPPGFFQRYYPEKVNTHDQRYAFENSSMAFWSRVNSARKSVALVTWDGVWAPTNWRKPKNILWKGDQSNCLMWCNHTDRYFQSDANGKAQLTAMGG